MHASERPDALAYTFIKESGDEDSITYSQLLARSNALAKEIAKLAQPGDRALLIYPPGLEFIEAFLASLAAGVIAVPTYPPRRNRSGDRFQAILNDSAPSLILTTNSMLDSIKSETESTGREIRLRATDQSFDMNANTSLFVGLALTADTIAFMQYTSGSTGNPRGVVVTHGNIVSNESMIQKNFGYTREDKMVSWLPVFHDMGLIGGVLQPLFTGFPAILFSPRSFLLNPIGWLQVVSDQRATTTGAPNFAWDLISKAVTQNDKQRLDLSSLQLAFNGSEPIRAETIDAFHREFAECGFRKEAFFPCFGLAESMVRLKFCIAGKPPDTNSIELLQTSFN